MNARFGFGPDNERFMERCHLHKLNQKCDFVIRYSHPSLPVSEEILYKKNSFIPMIVAEKKNPLTDPDLVNSCGRQFQDLVNTTDKDVLIRIGEGTVDSGYQPQGAVAEVYARFQKFASEKLKMRHTVELLGSSVPVMYGAPNFDPPYFDIYKNEGSKYIVPRENLHLIPPSFRKPGTIFVTEEVVFPVYSIVDSCNVALKITALLDVWGEPIRKKAPIDTSKRRAEKELLSKRPSPEPIESSKRYRGDD